KYEFADRGVLRVRQPRRFVVCCTVTARGFELVDPAAPTTDNRLPVVSLRQVAAVLSAALARLVKLLLPVDSQRRSRPAVDQVEVLMQLTRGGRATNPTNAARTPIAHRKVRDHSACDRERKHWNLLRKPR